LIKIFVEVINMDVYEYEKQRDTLQHLALEEASLRETYKNNPSGISNPEIEARLNEIKAEREKVLKSLSSGSLDTPIY
jgi:Tfp pilus assembly protein PilO